MIISQSEHFLTLRNITSRSALQFPGQPGHRARGKNQSSEMFHNRGLFGLCDITDSCLTWHQTTWNLFS